MAKSDVKVEVGRLGAAARWGEPRPPSRLIRIDRSAADALMSVPEADRRRVASDAIRRAAKDYAACPVRRA